MKKMKKRNSEHKRDISTDTTSGFTDTNFIIDMIILCTCFVCMNRHPSPLGTLARNIGGQIRSIRICVSCQKNMSLYNGISTSSFTHITEDPEGSFDYVDKELSFDIDQLSNGTKDQVIEFIIKRNIKGWSSQMSKADLLILVAEEFKNE